MCYSDAGALAACDGFDSRVNCALFVTSRESELNLGCTAVLYFFVVAENEGLAGLDLISLIGNDSVLFCANAFLLLRA